MIKIFKKKKKILEYFLSTIFFPLSIIFVLFIRLVKPIFLIRYAYIISTRIGHLGENLEFYLCAKKEKLFAPKIKYLDIFYLNTEVSNEFLVKLLKREILIFPRFIMHPVDKINRFFDYFYDTKDIHTIGRYKKNLEITPKPPWLNRDIYHFYENHGPQLKLSDNELNQGYFLLEKLGVKKTDKYVTIYSRDSKYLKIKYPKIDWSHHDFRNIDIDAFIPATELLINNGYKVIRIGNIVNKKMSFKHENFIDYPYSGHVSDFMDIFIQAKSNFCISTSSGIDCITSMFRKKVVFPCLCPILDTKSSTSNHLLGYRHLIYKKTGKKITLKEIVDKNLGFVFYDNQKYEDIGLEPVDPLQIKSVVKDMILIEKNEFFKDEEFKKEEKKFYELFNQLPKIHPQEGLYHPKKLLFQISKNFLNQNKWWIN